MPFIVILLHQRIAARQLGGNRCRQGGQRVGHVIRLVILRRHQLIAQRWLRKRQIAQAGIAQGTLTNIGVLHTVAVEFIGVINREEFVRQFVRQSAGERFAHGGDGDWIDNGEHLGDFVGRRQG